jgi:hypothetical protein
VAKLGNETRKKLHDRLWHVQNEKFDSTFVSERKKRAERERLVKCRILLSFIQ